MHRAVRGLRAAFTMLAGAMLSTCTNELAPTGTITLRVEKAAAWADTLEVAEVASLAVVVTSLGESVPTGVAIEWGSTDSSIAVVTSPAPAAGASASERRFASLRSLVSGLATGRATIVARVVQEGLAPVELRSPVVVRSRGRDSLVTVGHVDTLRVSLQRAGSAFSNGATITWVSSDPSVVQVLSPLGTDATRAQVTARIAGTATVTATVQGPLARAVFPMPVRAGAVVVTPAATWPDTLTVTDSTRLSVNVNSVGARVKWSTTNVAAFTVDSTGMVTAFAEGGGQIVASVGEPPFQTFEFRKNVVVRPLQVVELAPWVSSVNVTNSAALAVTVLNAFGQPKAGLPVTWRSTNEAAFSVDATGLVRGKARGGGELVATVGAAPFQAAEHRKSFSVLQKWSSVSAGLSHTCAIAASDRSAWCWGSNRWGELGNGTLVSAGLPTRVASVLSFAQLAAGGSPDTFGESHTCGVVGTSTVLCWGSNSSGQMGDGSNPCNFPQFQCARPLPQVAIDARTINKDVISLTSGGRHTCALLFDHAEEPSLSCWGLDHSNSGGGSAILQFGFSPQQRGIALSVMAGGEFICGMTWPSFHLQCAGTNRAGQLGDNSTTDQATFSTSVLDAAGQVVFSSPSAAGGAHACAQPAAQLLCWGSNSAGQLGVTPPASLGGPAMSWRAVAVPLADVASATAGLEHTCARTGSNDAWCWGSNSDGQLGNGASGVAVNQAPVRVSGGLKFTSISAGGRHTCGVTADGSLYCWGNNASGQLGDGTGISRSAPVRVGEPP